MPSFPFAATSRRSFMTGFLLIGTHAALASEDRSDKRFRRVGGELICCCGCGDGLLSCNHVGCQEDARMIRELREQLTVESSDLRVLQWFAKKYGATVLAAPLRGGFDRVAWVVPPLLGGSSIVGIFMLLTHWRRRSRAALPRSAAEVVSADLLLRVRQETLL